MFLSVRSVNGNHTHSVIEARNCLFEACNEDVFSKALASWVQHSIFFKEGKSYSFCNTSSEAFHKTGNKDVSSRLLKTAFRTGFFQLIEVIPIL